MSKPRYLIGIDLGGTKIEGVVMGSDINSDTATLQELWRHRIPTPRLESPEENYEAIVESLVSLIGEARQSLITQTGINHAQANQLTVGIGSPGALNPQGLMRNSNTICLNGRPLWADLKKRLSNPLRINNDANCFALSEALEHKAELVFGVIIGTGCGGGLIIHQQVINGHNAIAGEWGHNPLPWPRQEWGEVGADAPRCYCGKHGCLETWISGPALVADFMRLQGLPASVASDTTMRAQDIIAQVEKNNPIAHEAMKRYEDRLARGLATVINIVDPTMIILGGGLSNIHRLYKNVPALLPHYVFSDTVQTPIIPPKHGDSSGVRGAALLWRT